MTSIHLQFHAAPDEAVLLALSWSRRWGMFPVLESAGSNDDARLITPSELDEPRTAAGLFRVAMCSRIPVLAEYSANEFPLRNPDCLFLVLGQLSDKGLPESALSGATEDPDVLKKWRAVKRVAKSSMHVGATVRNPKTGAEALLPAQRHTLGAHALAETGTRMLAIAGWNEYHFDDVARERPPKRNAMAEDLAAALRDGDARAAMRRAIDARLVTGGTAGSLIEEIRLGIDEARLAGDEVSEDVLLDGIARLSRDIHQR